MLRFKPIDAADDENEQAHANSIVFVWGTPLYLSDDRTKSVGQSGKITR
jgi:hypothetical protein